MQEEGTLWYLQPMTSGRHQGGRRVKEVPQLSTPEINLLYPWNQFTEDHRKVISKILVCFALWSKPSSFLNQCHETGFVAMYVSHLWMLTHVYAHVKYIYCILFLALLEGWALLDNWGLIAKMVFLLGWTAK